VGAAQQRRRRYPGDTDETHRCDAMNRSDASSTQMISAFEELICGAARRLFLCARAFQPFDFAVEQRYSFAEFFDRQQCEVLSDFMDQFLFWPVLVLVRCHFVRSFAWKS
jgi:hypothetical protein